MTSPEWPGLTRLLAPRSVAVVGATDRPGSYAGHTLLNLRRAGFPGKVVGIHPRHREVMGVRCVPSLTDLAHPVDAVVVATPADTVAELLEQAGQIGCGGAVVYAAGFAELGRAGAQVAAMAPALRHGLPVLGPNCNGVVAAACRAPLWGDAVRLPAEPGPVAVVTQSGNVGVVALAHRGGTGLHTVVSVGNAAVVDSPDVVTVLARTAGVRAIALYVEADGDGRAWASAFAACAERDVRLAVLKVGRSTAGRAAGAAHTAALAGDHRVFAALVTEAGGVLVDDPHRLLETARALAAGRRDARGLAVLTCSGGDAAIAADLAAGTGCRLATLGRGTLSAVASRLPPGTVLGNPLDHTNIVWGDAAAVAGITETVAGDADVGHLLYVQDRPPGSTGAETDEWQAMVSGALLGAARAGVAVGVVATCPGQEPPEAIGGLWPALSAISALQRPPPEVSRLLDIAAAATAVTAAPHLPVPVERPGGIGEHEAKQILRAHGIAVPDGGIAPDPAAAAEIAQRLRSPVAVKLTAAGLLHKSAVGAIALDLRTPEEVVAAARRLLAIDGLDPGRRLLVEAMAPPGLDVLVAARTDGVVPVLVLGIGGIWAEALDDVAIIALPVDRDRVIAAVSRLRASAMVRGSAGEPRALAALVDLAVRAAEVLLAERLSLLELNPVRVTAHHAVALDAVAVRPAPQGDADSMRSGPTPLPDLS